MSKYFDKSFIIRCFILVCAMFMNGLGMTIMRMSCLGTEPFSCLNYSVSEYFDISMGTSVAMINGVILIISLLFMRTLLGIGTIATILCMGTAADIWNVIITSLIGHTVTFQGMEHLIIRLVLLAIGMFIMMVCCAFIMSCGLGMAPYDTLGYIVEKHSHQKIPFKWARVFFDSSCVLVAYFLAHTRGKEWELIGIGTILMAFCIGPFISFLRRRLTDVMMNKIMD